MTDTATGSAPDTAPDRFLAYIANLCRRPGARARLRRSLAAADPVTDADILILLGPFIPHDLDEGRLVVSAAVAGLYATYGTGPGRQWWSPGSELGASLRTGRINEARADRVLRSLLRPASTAERVGHLRRVLPSCSEPSRLDWSLLRRDLIRLDASDARRVSQRWARDYAQQRTNRSEGDQT